MTDTGSFRSDAPWRHQFDNARDPYTARNALGISEAAAAAPIDAEYIVAVDDPTLTSDRALTDTATVTWDFATAGQAKANTVGFSVGAWGTWSPTVTSSSGTITSTTINAARYIQAGKAVTAHFDISITNAGTGTGFLVISLPVTVANPGGGGAFAMEYQSTGVMCGGSVTSAATVLMLSKYDGTSVVVTGYRFRGIAIYEGA